MKTGLFLVLALATISVSAKLPPPTMSAPGYQSLAKIDASIAALAEGGKGTGLARRPPTDVNVHSATMLSDKTGNETIEVDVGNKICPVQISVHQPPPGIAGNPSYSGKVLSCRSYLTVKAVDVLKYEVIRPALIQFAQAGKIDLSFRVNGIQVDLLKRKK